MINPSDFIKLIPKAALWVQQQEQEILSVGTPLSETQLQDAKQIPVLHPEKVRILRVSYIPLPDDPELKFAAQAIQLITPNTWGLSLRYGILIRDDRWNNRETLIHELVHTSQYERLGGHAQFLNQYLTECIYLGYPAAPLEQEAINRAKLICTQQQH
jgi:hypothetical protein